MENEQSEGEYLVGMTFNPSGDLDVSNIKRMAAEMIDFLSAPNVDDSNPEALRCAALAMTAFEEGAMWAVKALTKPARK